MVLDSAPEDKYLIIGCDLGLIVTYLISDLNCLISRHDVCRSKILMIREDVKDKNYLVYEET